MLTLYRRPRMRRNVWYYRPESFNGGRRLPVDFQNNEDEFVILAPVAGLKPEDLKIEVHDDVLTLSGEVKPEENGDHQYLLREIDYGAFRRSLRLPNPVEADKAEAKIENGVLTLRLPKVEEARPKTIEVKAK